MIQISGRSVHGSRLSALAVAVVLIVATTSAAQAMIIRHDVDDAEYLQSSDAYPAVFEIFDQRGGVAALIAPQWALTAAHVGQDVPQGHQVTIAGQSYAVERVILHPDFKRKMLEMALLELDRSVQGVEPIPLYEQRGRTGPDRNFRRPWR